MGEAKHNPVAQFAKMMPGDPFKGKRWQSAVVPKVGPKENVVVVEEVPAEPEEGVVYYKLGEVIKPEHLDILFVVQYQVIDPTIALPGPQGTMRHPAIVGQTPFIVGRLDYQTEMKNVTAEFDRPGGRIIA